MSGPPAWHAGSTVMARLAEPTAAPATRLAVVADPHVSTRATGSPKQFEHTASLLAGTVADINRRGVDAVVSVGDLTKDGAPWDFDRVDTLLADLDAPFFAVPGNHDVPKTFDSHPPISRGRFLEQYTPGRLPYRVQIGGIDLFGLDSATTPSGDLRNSHDGRITASQLDWLTDRVESSDCPVVVTHHNLPPTLRQADASAAATDIDMSDVPIMRNGDAVVESLAAAGAPLVVTGHVHLPGVAPAPRGVTGPPSSPQRIGPPSSDPQAIGNPSPQGISRPTNQETTNSQLPTQRATGPTPVPQEGDTPASALTEITAPATCTFPQAYLLVDIDSRGTTVRYVPIASPSEAMAAYSARLTGSDTDRAQAALGATRTAQFPLTEEWLPAERPAPEPTAAQPTGSVSEESD